MPSPTSLSSVRADAIARRDRGDLHSARTLLERALEAATMTSGEDHPEVLTTSHLLAKLHRQAGDLAGARRVLENALYAGSHRHGDEHPMLLSISFDLAEIADELGNRHEARKHYTRIARFGPGAPGYDQQQVQAARAWLGPSAPPVAPVQGRPVTLPAPEPIIAPPPPPPPPPVEEAPKTEWPPLTPIEEEQPPTLPRRVPGGTDFAKPIPTHLTDDDIKEKEKTPTPATAAALYSPTEEVPQIRREATPPPTRTTVPLRGPLSPLVPPKSPLPQLPAEQPVSPPPPLVLTAPAPQSPPPPPPQPKRGKGMLIASLVAAVVAVVAAGITVFLVLGPKGNGEPTDVVPTGPDGAPTGVALLDRGDRITLTWTDPSNGSAQPIVVGNREDEATRRLGVPAKGATETTLLSLNKNYEYCFSILLAYSVDDIRQSEQVCTNRKKASSPPTP